MGRSRPNAGVLAFGSGLAIIGLAAILAIAGSSLRLTGYNDAPVQVDVASVPPDARACQPTGPLWAGTAAVRLSGRIDGAPSAVLRADRGRVMTSTGTAPWTKIRSGDDVVLPVASAAADSGTSLCVTNHGPATLFLSGVVVGAEARVTVTGSDGEEWPGTGRFRIEGLVSAQPASGWRVIGRVPERVATATGVAAGPWLGIGGLMVAVLATAALLWRRSEELDEG